MVCALNGPNVGPSSAPLPLLTGGITGLTLGYDGTNLRAGWSGGGLAGVTGYVAELSKDGAVIDTRTPTAPSQVFASGLTSGSTFQARVRAVAGAAEGPWSPYAAGPRATAVAYTYDAAGRLQHMSWDGRTSAAFSFDDAGNLLSIITATS